MQDLETVQQCMDWRILFAALSQREQLIIKLRGVPFVPRSLFKRGGRPVTWILLSLPMRGGRSRLTMTMVVVVVRIKCNTNEIVRGNGVNENGI
jgi:hypothetical protein